jgi:diguanylate cyclase (GGDEF)-like protein
VEGWYYRLNPEFTDGTTGFYNLISGNSTVKEMPVTDILAYPDKNAPNVSWYYSAIDKTEASWQAPYYFPGHSKQLISYTIPVYIGEDLLGLVGIDMDFEYLVERINQINVYDNGFAVLLAPDGVSRYNNQDRQDGIQPHTKATVELENGMYLELRAEYRDIQKNIHPMLNRIVSAFVCVLLLSIVYTAGVTYQIVKPLKDLTALVENFSAGEIMDVQWPAADAKDEIGTLSRILKNAYQKINDYTTYINELAYHDALTGAQNNTAYKNITDKLNRDIAGGAAQFGVLMVDINNLKKTNDRWGHEVGDMLIEKTARILMDTFQNNAVYRVGGDEFVAILTGKDYENHRELLSRLDKHCSANAIKIGEINVSVSFARGFSAFDPAVDKTYKDVFYKADHAMYEDKEQCKVFA